MNIFWGQLGEKGITAQAKMMLMEYDWPGNIRELLNILERAAIVAESTIGIEHIPSIKSNIQSNNVIFGIPDGGINLDEVEKNFYTRCFEESRG